MFARPSGIVSLTTDFGPADPYVGIMKGALLRASN
jgi:S-adenosylmethionine hydrolase